MPTTIEQVKQALTQVQANLYIFEQEAKALRSQIYVLETDAMQRAAEEKAVPTIETPKPEQESAPDNPGNTA